MFRAMIDRYVVEDEGLVIATLEHLE